MVNNFGNSVIKQWLQKSGWGNNVLKFGSFFTFLKPYFCKSRLLGKVCTL